MMETQARFAWIGGSFHSNFTKRAFG